MTSSVCSDDSDSADSLEETEEEAIPQFQRKRSHHRSTCAGTSAFIPHNILKRHSVVSVATGLNITPVQQAALTKAVIQEAGGDPRRVAKSYSTADKARRSITSAIAKDIQENWIALTAATLGWQADANAHKQECQGKKIASVAWECH